MRVLLVESHGEGGICHYTYCLANALAQEGNDVQVASAHPYELASAPRQFVLRTPFGHGNMRRAIQTLTGRRLQPTSTGISISTPPGQVGPEQSGPVIAPASSAQKTITPVTGLAGTASRWLTGREYRASWKTIVKLVKRQHIDVVHIQWITDPQEGLAWITALKAAGAAVVMTAHNVLPHDAPPSVRGEWSRLYQAVGEIIVHYQSAVTDLSHLGVDPGRVTVIPHGNYLPLSALTTTRDPLSADRASARVRLGLLPDAPVMFCFGMMRPYKGIEYLLDAVALLRQALPSVNLILAGRAPNGAAPFERQIANLGIRDNVTFLPRFLDLSEAALCFAASDVVVLPYVEASQSGVIQLSYAYHRPVVSTSVGGLPEAVIEGVTGALVPPRDVRALATALWSLLQERGKCDQLGEQGFHFAASRFSWVPIASATSSVYSRAMSHRDTRRKLAHAGAK